MSASNSPAHADVRAFGACPTRLGLASSVSTSKTQETESQFVILVMGLFIVGGLLYISLIALSGPAWMGVLFGLVEIGVAWRVAPPPGARVLRWITGSIGVITILWAIVWGLAS